MPEVNSIELFEADSHIGGHTNTVGIELDDKHYNVDTGFIVFNKRTYPNFLSLLSELNVDYQPSEMGFSVSSAISGLEYCGSSLNALFSQRRNLINPRFYKLLRAIVRFNTHAPAWLNSNSDNPSLGDFLNSHGYYSGFIDNYIIPMGAAIWSTPPKQMLEFPARTFIQFFKNHGLLTVADHPQWYVIKGGSKVYVEKLIAPFKKSVHVNNAVKSVRRYPTHVELITTDGTHRFDYVFIGSHSDEALAMLSDTSANEREILSAIKYHPNEAILHTDISLLPKKRRAWAAWNYFVPDSDDMSVVLTYNMNILQNIQAPCEFCVTLNNSDKINPKRVLSRIQYAHPIFDRAAIDAQKRWPEINGTNRSYFCGAYWGYGFHEDGVNSALRAINLFSEKIRYEQQNIQRMDKASTLSVQVS